MANPSAKLQTLIKAGVVTDHEKLTPEMLSRIETLTDEEITHMIAIKEKLGVEHIQANQGFILN